MYFKISVFLYEIDKVHSGPIVGFDHIKVNKGGVFKRSTIPHLFKRGYLNICQYLGNEKI